MKAQRIVITRSGGPGVLRLESFEPALPGPGELAIDVRASGVNFADIFCRLGLYAAAPPAPFAPGFEVAGVVGSVGGPGGGEVGSGGGRAVPEGDDAVRFAPGDRVMAVTRFGGYASRINVPSALVRHLPSGWSFAQGAAFPVAFLTAWHGLINVGRLVRGETVVIQSAAGGVGTAACQIAKAIGARVVGTVGSERKRKTAAEAGAEVVVVSPDYRVWGEIMRDVGRVDVVFDAVGGRGIRQGYESLRPGGRLVQYGFAEMMPRGGIRNWPLLAMRWIRTPRFSPFDMTGKNRSVAGFNLVYLFDRLDLFADAIGHLEALVAQGRIRPVVGATFPFTDAPSAHELLQSRRSEGKVILSW